ncbi:BatD family protein [Rhodoflexus sp.]
MWVLQAQAQEIQIEIPKTEIPINESFQIRISAINVKISDYGAFPTIKGFTKSDISSGDRQILTNGRITPVSYIVQNYRPLKEGSYTVPPFSIIVNGESVSSPGVTVNVVEASVSGRDFWSVPDLMESEIAINRGNIFLEVITNTKEVYVGEGFNVMVAFYESINNPLLISFPSDMAQRVAAMSQKLKPDNCWEENFNVPRDVIPVLVKIKGKDYKQYKVYQSQYYVNKAGEIQLPQVSLPLVKWRLNNSGREEMRNYSSKPLKIKVKPLPPHPLSDRVAVGRFKLEEKVGQTRLQTGQSTSYDFQITGEGNFAFIREPDTRRTLAMELYPPNVQQQINREGSRVTGSKKFTYMIIPNEPGTYKMADYFQWIFFNTEKNDYDTLKPSTVIEVAGESRADNSISNSSSSAYYDGIYKLDNNLKSLESVHIWKWLLTFALGICAVAGLVIALAGLKRK